MPPRDGKPPRPLVDDLQNTNRVIPQADPRVADTYVRPGSPDIHPPQQTNPFTKLASSLGSLHSQLKPVMENYVTEWTKDQEAQAVADWQSNKQKWADAVKQGQIPVGANPHAARAVKRLMLSELADDFHTHAALAFQGPEGQAARETNDPQVMRQFLDSQQQKFYAAHLKNGEKDLYDPLDVQEAWQPKLARTESELMRAHATYRVQEVERELKDTVGATISRAVDDTFAQFSGPGARSFSSLGEEERRKVYQDLSSKITAPLLDKDHGALGTGLDKKEAWDLVTDTIVARALASKDHGRDILETLDHITRPDGPALRDIPYVQQKRLQAEEHLTSLEIQQENRQWQLEQRPLQRAKMGHEWAEFAKQDERYEQEKKRWAEHAADKNDEAIYKSLLGRLYQGLDHPNAKRGVEIINEVLRDAKAHIPDKVESLNQLLHVTHQRKAHVEDDPQTVARIYLQMQKNPLGFDENQLLKEVAAGNLSVSTMRGAFDDLDRKRTNASHPFLRQPEITEMIHQVTRGAMQNPADEFSAEGQLRASEAIGSFRDKAAAWIAKNPKGTMPEFTEYMRDQLGPILERVNKDYGDTVKAERKKEEDRGHMVVDKTKQVVEQRDARLAVQQKKQEEEQKRRDEVTNFNQTYRPTGKKTKEGRDILADGQGKIASEHTITIKDIPEINNGGITNIPTVFGGKKYSDADAIEIIRKNKGVDPDTGKPLRRYWSVTDATIAAREKAKRIEKEYIEELKKSSK